MPQSLLVRFYKRCRTLEETAVHLEDRFEKQVTCHAHPSLRMEEESTTSVKTSYGHFRRQLGEVIDSQEAHVLVAVLIIVSNIFVIKEADRTAAGEDLPLWLITIGYVFCLLFAFEMCCRVYVHRIHFFTRTLNLIEFTIVFGDVVLEFYKHTSDGNVFSLSIFRLFRFVRFFRVFRMLSGYRELYLMLHGMQSAMKAMMWSMVMVAGVLIMWAILAVEIIRPSLYEVDNHGKFEDCPSCKYAFDTVWTSVLTLISSIIAGDSWGMIAIPVMKHRPTLAFFFLGSFMTINLGLLNLIMAAIVDRAAQARQEDEQFKLTEKADNYKHCEKRLYKVCQELDTDQNGVLTIDELRNGVDNVPDFAHILKIMEVTDEDLDNVFTYMDVDGSGAIDYKEFAHQVHRLKTCDPHTLLILLGQQVRQIVKDMKAQNDKVKEHHEKVAERIANLHTRLAGSMGLQSSSSLMAGSVESNSSSQTPRSLTSPRELPESLRRSSHHAVTENAHVDNLMQKWHTLEQDMRQDLERLHLTLKECVANTAGNQSSGEELSKVLPRTPITKNEHRSAKEVIDTIDPNEYWRPPLPETSNSNTGKSKTIKFTPEVQSYDGAVLEKSSKKSH